MANFDMFTKDGNDKVEDIVNTVLAEHDGANINRLYTEVVTQLEKLSNQPNYHEAMDTAVREAVWAVLEQTDNYCPHCGSIIKGM